jgi:hypothetical protein
MLQPLVGLADPASVPVRLTEGQVMAIYQHIRHPRITSRLAERPVKVADLGLSGSA